MKFTVRIMDIANKGALLHGRDARTLGVHDGDRVQIINEAKGTAVQAHVDTTSTIIDQGTIGIYRPTADPVGAEEGMSLEVREADRPPSLSFIKKKMDGGSLAKDELLAITRDIVDDTLSPGEISAFITASYINELSLDEVEWLTRAMVDTGERISFVSHPIVDKHSIGGVPGNKISLLVVPIIAAAGLKIPKTSSRAITGTAGTADLMEVLAPVSFSAAEVQQMTEKVGGCIVWGGATNIAPADDKIIKHEYPLKIDARGQMLASVMAKKFAAGADLVVIDIPVGENTKIPTVAEGRRLAREFIDLGDRLGMEVECALTYGESPVGHTIGPKLEVREALSVLEGASAPSSLIQKSLAIAGIALEMAGKAARGQGAELAESILSNGDALAKLKEIIEIQGGDPGVTAESIEPGEHQLVVNAPERGYVIELNNTSLIAIARAAGAPHDHGAGVDIHAKKGTRVQKGDPIFTIHADRSWRLDRAVEEGRRLMPVVVEGMLLDRLPGDRWV
ncbi:MAG: AMP phosphorylase [Methanomicrobiales archaeon]